MSVLQAWLWVCECVYTYSVFMSLDIFVHIRCVLGAVFVSGWADTVLLFTYINENDKEASNFRPPTRQILF